MVVVPLPMAGMEMSSKNKEADDAPLLQTVVHDMPAAGTPAAAKAGGCGSFFKAHVWKMATLLGWIFFFAALLSRKSASTANAGSCSAFSGTPSGTPATPSTSSNVAVVGATTKFLIVGDWGRQGGYNQSRNAAGMAKVASSLGAQFVVSTGDNFYEQGLANLTDPGFMKSFVNVYNQASLQVPWFAAVGNHDWYTPGNVSVQLDPALRAKDKRWHAFQSTVKSFYASPGDPAPLLSLFFIDTSPWVTAYRAQPNSMMWSWGGIAGVDAPVAYDSVPARTTFMAWEDAAAGALAAQLQASNARWQIVVGHHPVYSFSGRHGSTRELARINGILRRAGAHGYMNGHDHNLQLIVPPVPAASGTADVTSSSSSDTASTPGGTGFIAPAGPFYLTSGAGSKTSNDVAKPSDGSLVFSLGSTGFNSLELNATSLVLKSYNMDGQLLHTYTPPWSPAPLCDTTPDGLPGALLSRAPDYRCSPPPEPVDTGAGISLDINSAGAGTGSTLAVQAAAWPQGKPVPFDQYQLKSQLMLSGGTSWDYVMYDAVNKVVYLGRRSDGLQFVDVRDPMNPRLGGTIPGTTGANGVILMPSLGLGAGICPGAPLFTLPKAPSFTYTVLGNIAFDPSFGTPDGGVFMPAINAVGWTFPHRPNKVPGSLAVYNITQSVVNAAMAGSMPPPCGTTCFTSPSLGATAEAMNGIFGGGLEAPRTAPDSASAWVQLEAGSISALVDGVSGSVRKTFDLRAPGCANPAGSEVDAVNNVLFVGCRGGAMPGNIGTGIPILVAINITSGDVLFTSRIGRHVDGVAYMPPDATHTGRVFVSCGGDATIMVFEQAPGGGAYRPLEAIATRPGAKTMAVDPVRRLVFTAVPSGSANYRGRPLASGPGKAADELSYPNTWQAGSFTLLTYQPVN